MRFIRHLRNVIQFMQLSKNQRKLTFYSEGENYWPNFEGLIRELLKKSNLHVCYISSSSDDPGLFISHPNYQAFEIDEGYVRNWLFENIQTDVMVMTMPDLGQYQVKRSKHKVHYVYIQHSLASLHTIYHKGAFDNYDSIFCAGPHHIKEIRAIEDKYNLPSKNLFEHGYGRLDLIIKEAKIWANKKSYINKPRHILIAPSWGPKGTIETGVGEKIIDQLIGDGYRVTLRPHPQTLKFAQSKINKIINKHSKNELFNFESNILGQESLFTSDIMISDWSGAALDYAFGLGKPVVFVNVPQKINNLDYNDVGLEPFEESIRGILGQVIKINDICNIGKILESSELCSVDNNVFNIGKSAEIGCTILMELCEKK